ncbi:MAG: hypothetical protein JWM91_3547 [Rhodospirillales bacterium]|nr:hypothetical protein [Rhodospirillales bacterium]
MDGIDPFSLIAAGILRRCSYRNLIISHGFALRQGRNLRSLFTAATENKTPAFPWFQLGLRRYVVDSARFGWANPSTLELSHSPGFFASGNARLSHPETLICRTLKSLIRLPQEVPEKSSPIEDCGAIEAADHVSARTPCIYKTKLKSHRTVRADLLMRRRN